MEREERSVGVCETPMQFCFSIAHAHSEDCTMQPADGKQSLSKLSRFFFSVGQKSVLLSGMKKLLPERDRKECGLKKSFKLSFELILNERVNFKDLGSFPSMQESEGKYFLENYLKGHKFMKLSVR